jgi:hypothetical protein
MAMCGEEINIAAEIGSMFMSQNSANVSLERAIDDKSSMMIRQDCEGDDDGDALDDDVEDNISSAVAPDGAIGDDKTSILLCPRIKSILTRMRFARETISSCIAARIPGEI